MIWIFLYTFLFSRQSWNKKPLWHIWSPPYATSPLISMQTNFTSATTMNSYHQLSKHQILPFKWVHIWCSSRWTFYPISVYRLYLRNVNNSSSHLRKHFKAHYSTLMQQIVALSFMCKICFQFVITYCGEGGGVAWHNFCQVLQPKS